MREIWVDDVKYASRAAFLHSIGISKKGATGYFARLNKCIKKSVPFSHAKQLYRVSLTQKVTISCNAENNTEQIAKRPCRRLLTYDHATFGLHQDKGDHYR